MSRTSKFRLILFGLLLASILLPWPTHGADCSDSPLSPRLTQGGVARVSYLQGKGVTLRFYPGPEARSVGTLPEGAAVTVLRGPTCAEGIHWWRVRSLGGQLGWAAEGMPNEGYMLEPWQILLDMLRPTLGGFEMIRVNDKGLMGQLTAYPVPSLTETAKALFPPLEFDPLNLDYQTQLKACPIDTPRNNPGLAGLPTLDLVPAETGDFTAYPAPDSTRLLLVRHLWLSVIRCDGSASDMHGIDRVSLVVSGKEKTLFDVPASAHLPGFTRQNEAINRVVALRWSPGNLSALAWVRYGEGMKLLLVDAREGKVATLGDGAFPSWMSDGELVGWLRRDGLVTNLIIAHTDSLDRQTIVLPASLSYFDARFPPLWNDLGTRLVACSRANACKTVVMIDVDNRRASAPLYVPPEAALMRWVLGDSGLLFVPGSGGELTLTMLNGSQPRPLSVPLSAGERIAEARPFPGGKAVLLTIRGSGQAERFVVMGLESGELTAVGSGTQAPG